MRATFHAAGAGARRFTVLPILLLALALLAAGCSSSKKSNGTVVTASVQPAAETATSSSVATRTGASAASSAAAAAPTATPDQAPLAQFAMPKFNVTAKVVVKGVDPATNTMQSPDNKDDVAYYDFTSRPGYGCKAPEKCANTVLAGHVDWFTGQTGVFWHLKDLKAGDEIDLKLQDGKTYKYKVVTNEVYKADSAPVDSIIGATPQPSVTLITCDGVFNKQLQEYNSRRVVRATLES